MGWSPRTALSLALSPTRVARPLRRRQCHSALQSRAGRLAMDVNLSNLLNGNAALSADMAARLEKAFKYPLKDLICCFRCCQRSLRRPHLSGLDASCRPDGRRVYLPPDRTRARRGGAQTHPTRGPRVGPQNNGPARCHPQSAATLDARQLSPECAAPKVTSSV